MEGASGPIGGPHHWHLARETRQLSLALKIYSTSPSVRGDAQWARPRPQRWRWLEARRKTANSLATPDRTNERTVGNSMPLSCFHFVLLCVIIADLSWGVYLFSCVQRLKISLAQCCNGSRWSAMMLYSISVQIIKHSYNYSLITGLMSVHKNDTVLLWRFTR